jgi:hypothetical protein
MRYIADRNIPKTEHCLLYFCNAALTGAVRCLRPHNQKTNGEKILASR